MPQEVRRPNARSAASIVRRVMVTKGEASERIAEYEATRHAVQAGFDALRQSIGKIKSMGIGIADLRPQLESRTVDKSTPRTALSAFAAGGSTVADSRLTIHVDPFANDLDEVFLLDLQISHILGVYSKRKTDTVWKCSNGEGLIAEISVEPKDVARLVHDVLLDIAMARASHAPWTGLRDTLSSRQLATKKFDFAAKKNLLPGFTYGNLQGANYVPLSALLPREAAEVCFSEAALHRYVDAWTKFSAYCKAVPASEVRLDSDAALHLAVQIVRQHRHGGQISIARLAKALSMLRPGSHRLYFLIHRGSTPAARARIGGFFHKNPAHLHTQIWIIHSDGDRDADAKYLIDRHWIVYYPFVIGGS